MLQHIAISIFLVGEPVYIDSHIYLQSCLNLLNFFLKNKNLHLLWSLRDVSKYPSLAFLYRISLEGSWKCALAKCEILVYYQNIFDSICSVAVIKMALNYWNCIHLTLSKCLMYVRYCAIGFISIEANKMEDTLLKRGGRDVKL